MLPPPQRAATAAFRGSRWWEESLYEGRLYLSTPDAAAAAAEDGEGRGRGDGAAADVDVGAGSRGRMRRILRGGAREERRYSARWLVLSRLPSASPAAADDSVNRRQQEEEGQEEEEAAIMLSAYYSEEDFLAGAPFAVHQPHGSCCHSPASCPATGTSRGLLRAHFELMSLCAVAQAAARC